MQTSYPQKLRMTRVKQNNKGNREDAQKRLRERLENSAKFRLGHGIVNGVVWQGIEVLEDDAPDFDELELSHHNWGVFIIDELKWIFLNVEIPVKGGGYRKWSFAFDCNASTT